MAAIDTPWLSRLGTPMSPHDDSSTASLDAQSSTGAPPTYAAFSPVTLAANTPSRSSRLSTILVHQKSPLLLATPPQITRALAYSHPFLLPLNTFAGLLTWSTGDPWQSFLLLCLFWAVVLYGDVLVRFAGPVMVGVGLIAGMYGRKYSPLSTSSWYESTGGAKNAASSAANTSSPAKGAKGEAAERQGKHQRNHSEITNTKHQKTLDEIVETLKEFTGRCNVLLDPLLDMTDFLSTQRTPTSATTKPALTAMFMRLVIITPFWVALTMPPWRILTTRRVVLVAGTLVLTWHARVMRVTRTLLWRSSAVRKLAAITTGLRFDEPARKLQSELSGASKSSSEFGTSSIDSELTKGLKRPSNLHVSHRRSGSEKSTGVKFSFIIYENQRRWVGLGWTRSLFAYERPAWTDEHNNSVPPKDDFELPEVEGGSNMRWQWAKASWWRVDGVADDYGPMDYDSEDGKNGWIYYDNKWQNGRRGLDGWGRWTRRRKWYRDAELVEVDESETVHDDARSIASTSALNTESYSTIGEKMISPMRSESTLPLSGDKSSTTDTTTTTTTNNTLAAGKEDAASIHSTTSTKSRSFFRPTSLRRRVTDRSSIAEKEKDKDTKEKERDVPSRRLSESNNEDDSCNLGIEMELELQKQGKEGGEWGIGDEARMSLE